MSDSRAKEKRSKRLHDEETHIEKQVKIAKQYGLGFNDKHIREPHRHAKVHAMNCGNPKCIMCSNPRKVFKEPTIQEKRDYQIDINDIDYLDNNPD